MIAEVRSALDALLGSNAILRNANGAGRIFELFVLTGIAARLQGRLPDVWLQRSDGTKVLPSDADRRFIQRGGAPSGLQPASAGADNASVIGFRMPGGREWEIWNGIQFQGRSGGTHEFDIAVVPAEVGSILRLTGGVPFGRPRVAIECKDVGDAGSVDETRAFIARLYDVTVLGGHRRYIPFPPPLQAIYPGNLAARPSHRAVATYWLENHRTLNVVARRTGFSLGSAALMVYYSIEPHPDITAGTPEAIALFDSVADWIVANCQQ